ncbi:hypothetical protein PoB_005284300 [Plakobranchus ocellatus]|uniref:Uncharacterized protein n=1 Tax=Plakobranchus ocellatus TaxID=259542 RepID=A0AAV4C5R7_9GAST|nr:hypothetical protein PoB_005284300 [Plakobranchus ocellatus]
MRKEGTKGRSEGEKAKGGTAEAQKSPESMLELDGVSKNRHAAWMSACKTVSSCSCSDKNRPGSLVALRVVAPSPSESTVGMTRLPRGDGKFSFCRTRFYF